MFSKSQRGEYDTDVHMDKSQAFGENGNSSVSPTQIKSDSLPPAESAMQKSSACFGKSQSCGQSRHETHKIRSVSCVVSDQACSTCLLTPRYSRSYSRTRADLPPSGETKSGRSAMALRYMHRSSQPWILPYTLSILKQLHVPCENEENKQSHRL